MRSWIFLILVTALGLPQVLAAAPIAPWSRSEIDAGVGHTAPSLVVGTSGELHLSFYTPETGFLRYAHNSGVGWTFEDVAHLSAFVSVAALAATEEAQLINTLLATLALDDAGTPGLIVAKTSTNEVRYYHRDPGGWSSEPVHPSAVVRGLVYDLNDTPHVLLETTALVHGIRGASGWEFGTVGAAAYLGSDIAMSPGGTVHVVYVTPGRDLVLAALENEVWTTQSIGASGTPRRPRIVFDPAERPCVTWQDSASSTVRFARRDNDAWIIEEPQSPPGHFFPVVLTASGEPAMAYPDVQGDLISYVERSAGEWTIQTVETQSLAADASLAFQADGRPLIAWAGSGGGIGAPLYLSGVTATVGVGGPARASHLLRVWPNPARSGQALRWASDGHAPGRMTVELIDIGGRRVRAEVVETSLSTLSGFMDLAGLLPGVYLVRIHGAGSLSAEQKIVIVE